MWDAKVLAQQEVDKVAGEALMISHGTETPESGGQRASCSHLGHGSLPQKLRKMLGPIGTPGGPRQRHRRAGAGSPGTVAAVAVHRDTSRGQ